MEYIKVWQKNSDCNSDYQICNYDNTTYDYKVHKNVIIDGQNCNTIINPSADIQAVDGIYVNENTTIQQGLLRTEPCEESKNFNYLKEFNGQAPDVWQQLRLSPR